MTLSHKKVLNALKKDFLCGWTNISGRADWVGTSSMHYVNYQAVETTVCAGHRNVQSFFMTPDGRVVHCLPGYWDPKWFLKEMQFAQDLNRLWQSKGSRVQKYNKFLNLHLSHALTHDHSLRKRSVQQGFDGWQIKKDPNSDFHRRSGFITGTLKRNDQIVHERMAERPFLPFERFGVATFVEMGKHQFDNHMDGCRHPNLRYGKVTTVTSFVSRPPSVTPTSNRD